MTPPQLTFIRDLVAERDLAILESEDADVLRRRDYVLALVRGEAVEPSSTQASAIIAWLLSLPKKPVLTGGNGSTFPDVAEGRYAVELGGTLRFFKVDRPTEGRWAGRQFLSEVIGGESRGRSIREHGEKRIVLNALVADEDGARARYGREIGRCGICNRTLTDELSRASGIGPECADKNGINREALATEDSRYVTEGVATAPQRVAGPDECDSCFKRAELSHFNPTGDALCDDCYTRALDAEGEVADTSSFDVPDPASDEAWLRLREAGF